MFSSILVIHTTVTLANFFITPVGLEDQLLGIVVQMEKPELERMKIDLMLKNVQLSKELKEIQENILFQLAENKDTDILENVQLIDTLAESKIKSVSIKEQVSETEKTEKEIDQTREQYRSVAYRGSILFFCISDMANVDPMYQYSLQWFIQLFMLAIEQAEQSEILPERLNSLISFFTYSLYNNICQSLFEQHKLLFSFILCIRILQGDRLIDDEEWRFFLTGGTDTSGMTKPNETWITEQMWTDIKGLAKLPTFTGFLDDFVNRPSTWRSFFDVNATESETIPCGWNDRLDSFQRILVLRCIRPDRVTAAITAFVTEKLGRKFIEPPRFDLARSFRDASNTVPLIFILSPGADPKSELDKFADSMRVKKMDSISLGQGTEKRAEQAIKDAIQNGTWVLLQVCNLCILFSFIQILTTHTYTIRTVILPHRSCLHWKDWWRSSP